MPCILKVRVISARDLPVMDKASELTDAYVELRFADHEVKRTNICRKTLNPMYVHIPRTYLVYVSYLFDASTMI
jgi:Ca2+-dependent lipid-binding protein